VWNLIDELKDIIRHQSTLIESTKAELQEVKHDQNVLHEQTRSFTRKSKPYEHNSKVRGAPSARSWAAVVANATNADPVPSQHRPDKDQNCVRISTQRSFVEPDDNNLDEGNTFGRYLPTESANSHIRTALLIAPATQDAQVAGVGTTKTGYLIRFKDRASAEAARTNTEWLNELGNNTKLVKPRFRVVWYIVLEQGFQIEEVAWLKRKDNILGKIASLGIWFDSAEGAEYILNNGLLVGQRYIGSVERREMKKKRCFRCQRFGHLAWSCKEIPRCGHCAGPHERQRSPPGIRARCLDCSGEHPTGDRECPQPPTTNPTQC
jgi:hypothetical protein